MKFCRYRVLSLAVFIALGVVSGCGTEKPPGSGSTGWGVRDLNNNSVDPFRSSGSKATVLIFVRTDCPISNRYAPEMERLFKKYSAEHIAFWLVYPDATTTVKSIREHQSDFRLTMPVLMDTRHDLVKKAGVTVTPEAAVFLGDGQEVYRGRIDDRYVDFGKERAAPTQRDLQEALEAIVAGKPVLDQTTTAVGCYISDLP